MGLIRLLLIAVVATAAYLIFRRMLDNPHRTPRPDLTRDDRLGRLVQDPECGVYVDSDLAVRRKAPDGELFFCSKACADAYFDKARHGA